VHDSHTKIRPCVSLILYMGTVLRDWWYFEIQIPTIDWQKRLWYRTTLFSLSFHSLSHPPSPTADPPGPLGAPPLVLINPNHKFIIIERVLQPLSTMRFTILVVSAVLCASPLLVTGQEVQFPTLRPTER
jgi:hypothetical protein